MRRQRRVTAVLAGLLLGIVTAGPVVAADPEGPDGWPVSGGGSRNPRVALRDRYPTGGQVLTPLAYPGATGKLVYSHSEAGAWPGWLSVSAYDSSVPVDVTSPGIGTR